MKKIIFLLFSLTYLLFGKTVYSVPVDNKMVGFYKLISASGYSNGAYFSLNETSLNGSMMSISKDGIISQIIFLNGNLISNSMEYITNLENNKVTTFDIVSGETYNVTYTFNNNILTVYLDNETDKWEKIYDVSSNTSNINSNINVNTNWQLFGALKDIDNMSIFNNSCVLYIWKYENNIWKIYVPNATQSVKNILNTLNIPTIKSIKKGTGFWIIGNSNCSIKY